MNEFQFAEDDSGLSAVARVSEADVPESPHPYWRATVNGEEWEGRSESPPKPLQDGRLEFFFRMRRRAT